MPFEVAFYTDEVTEPLVRLYGNTRRIGPKTESKIKLAVKQGLAITRNSCPVPKF